MAIKVLGGIKVITADPIESRLTLTKEQMLAIKDEQMPSVYFAICPDDGNFYLYNKENELDKLTGRYRIINESAIVQVAQKIQRTENKPADATSAWTTLADAQEYAFHNNLAYTGQVIYVQETDSFYKIGKNASGTTLLSQLPDEKFIAEINSAILSLSNRISEFGEKILASADLLTETLTLTEKLNEN